MSIPRPEFPNPQFERRQWQNLNGVWDFAFDFGNSGLAGGMLEKADWERQITVPFCPESKLSGIGYTDFIPAVWYRRTVEITETQLAGRVFLCFGAVDYETHVFVNGQAAGDHTGGYTSFRFDVTALLHAGENTIVVNAVDDTRSTRIPSGKQSERLQSYGCL
ncbi:MAG: beta-galactosidase, partial [Clostridia bacterium]|nr:beta-galactosidase [Clostridia bacterium]